MAQAAQTLVSNLAPNEVTGIWTDLQGALWVRGSAPPTIVTWTFTASSAKRALAPAWTANTVVATGDAVTAGGNLYIATTGGTTAASGSGPVAVGPGVVDGSVTWCGYAESVFSAGITVINCDPTSVAYLGDSEAQWCPIPPGYQSAGPVASASLSYVRAPSGSPTLACVASP